MGTSTVDRNRQLRAIREDVRARFGDRYEEIMHDIRAAVAEKAAEAGVDALRYAMFVYDSVHEEDDEVSKIGANAIIAAALDLADVGGIGIA